MKNLEVLQICIFGIHVELNAGHRNIEVDAVEDLAECRSGFEFVNNRWIGAGKIVGEGETHPVPHCSTLVTLSCSRLLSHATSSCLLRKLVYYRLLPPCSTQLVLTLILPF